MGNFNSLLYKGANRANTDIRDLPSDLHDLATNSNFSWYQQDSLKIPIYLSKNSKAKVYIIYCHANGEVMNAQLIKSMCSLLKMIDLPLNVLFFEYPGYGLMLGSVNTHNCYLSLCNVVTYCESINKHNYPILLYGRSIGAAFASRYCSDFPNAIDGIILESPFSDLHHILRGLCTCYRCCAPNIQCSKYLETVHIPKLLIYGSRDPLNPPQSQRELLSCFTSSLDFVLCLNNFSHNNIPFGNKKSKIVLCVPRTCCCSIVPSVQSQVKRFSETIYEFIKVVLNQTTFESIDIIETPEFLLDDHSSSNNIHSVQEDSINTIKNQTTIYNPNSTIDTNYDHTCDISMNNKNIHTQTKSQSSFLQCKIQELPIEMGLIKESSIDDNKSVEYIEE